MSHDLNQINKDPFARAQFESELDALAKKYCEEDEAMKELYESDEPIEEPAENKTQRFQKFMGDLTKNRTLAQLKAISDEMDETIGDNSRFTKAKHDSKKAKAKRKSARKAKKRK